MYYLYIKLASIHSKSAQDVYNIFPIMENVRSNKRSVIRNGYNSELNSHAIVKGNLKDIKFDESIASAVDGSITYSD